MKLKFSFVFTLLAITMLFYIACKKEVTITSPPTVTKPAIDTLTPAIRQIAKNLAQTLSGTYGGININKGLILPDFATRGLSKPNLSGLVSLCTFFPDTLVSYKTSVGDTVTSQTNGLFKFYFSCDTLKAPRVRGNPTYLSLNGYMGYDSLTTSGQMPNGLFAHNIRAFYEAKALDVNVPLVTNGSTSSLISFNGSIKSFIDTASSKKTLAPSSIHAYYTLNNVVVDLSKNSDIASGGITFAVVGEFDNIKWFYEGSVRFSGNHNATVTIRNKTYNIDWLTGKIIK